MNAQRTISIPVRTRVNHRRAASIIEHARAKLRRTRKRDRPAMLDRFIRQISRECVRVEIGQKQTDDKR